MENKRLKLEKKNYVIPEVEVMELFSENTIADNTGVNSTQWSDGYVKDIEIYLI